MNTAVSLRAILSKRSVVWGAFLLVHTYLCWIDIAYPQGSMNDPTVVYKQWVDQSVTGSGHRVGIDIAWVYPALAFIPMVLTRFFSDALIGQSWLIMVTALDAIVMYALTRRSSLMSSSAIPIGRCIAGWWWLVFLVFLGPISLAKLDSISAALGILGLLWAARRPVVAGVITAIAMWIKVWPMGLVIVMFVTLRRTRSLVLSAVSLVSSGVILVCLSLGSGLKVFGFLTQQTGRGIQLESPFALIWLGQRILGVPGIFVGYSPEQLTYEIHGPGVDTVAAMSTPALVLGIIAITIIASWAVARGAGFTAVAPPFALGMVTVLMLGNKVGSPQFVSWLSVPIVLGLVLWGLEFHIPALITLEIALVTQLIYPTWYDQLIGVAPFMVVLLALKTAGIVALFVWSVRALLRVERTQIRRTAAAVGGTLPESALLSRAG